MRVIDLIKEFVGGWKIGFEWYLLQCKRNKWYIIPAIIDVVMIPIKIPIIAVVMMIKPARRYLMNDIEEIKSEVEESK